MRLHYLGQGQRYLSYSIHASSPFRTFTEICVHGRKNSEQHEDHERVNPAIDAKNVTDSPRSKNEPQYGTVVAKEAPPGRF
jgi:hypothetical protein